MERIELHLHTNMSKIDGITDIEDYIIKAKQYGMKALAITDKAVVQAFPKAQEYLEKTNDNEFKVLYGMEAYFVPTNDIKDTIYHISILAKNKIGLKNLYKLVSISNLDYFHNKPILPKTILDQNIDGLLIGSACYKGELYRAILDGKSDDEIEQIASYYDYLEIQPISNNMCIMREGNVQDLEALQDINIKIVKLGKKLNKPVVATSDTHFLNKQDELYRKILQEAQGYEYADEYPPLYFRTTTEMLNEFEYLGQEKAYDVVVTNTNKIADMCEKIKPISDEKCYPYIKNAEIEIKDLAYKGAHRIYGNLLSTQVQERLDKELKSIIENDYATLYTIAQKLVQKSNEDGYIVGTRGISGASLVAYCLGITEVDPIKYNIPFEMFAGFNGDREPDFNLNFAYDYQKKAQEYVKEILEGGTTVKAGIIETITQGITRIKTTTGHYPGGVIVVPKDRKIYEFTPVQYAEDEPNLNVIVTHFDYHSIDGNLLRLDILGNSTSTMLHRLHELTGIDPTTIDLEDKETLNIMCSANTLDIPYFNSKQVKEIILETKPTTFDELIKIAGLYLGSDLWTNNAQYLIKNGIATLDEVITCRDDIMNDLIKAGIEPKIAYEIMETVRKGKPRCNKEPLWKDYKNIMKKHNIPEWYVKSCEKIRYAFPKAHLVSNAINAFRIAYYKVHYPNEFYKVYEEIQ